MNKAFLLTKDGVSELSKERDLLVAGRSIVADAIKTAREFGDLAENAEYQSARQEQEKLEARVTEIDHILQNVQVIAKPRGDSKVQIGSTVTLKNGATKTFQVVGTVEADPLSGKISDESPIGQALLGKKVGDKVEIVTPAETSTYKITQIT
ncbi:MAG: transcription elongation factor GreA [Patescibacteria group bacterium]